MNAKTAASSSQVKRTRRREPSILDRNTRYARYKEYPVGDAPYPVQPPSGSPVRTAILIGAIVALLASNVYLYLQIDRARTDMAKLREQLLTEISNLRETSTVTNQTAKHHIDALKEELESTRRQASTMATDRKS